MSTIIEQTTTTDLTTGFRLSTEAKSLEVTVTAWGTGTFSVTVYNATAMARAHNRGFALGKRFEGDTVAAAFAAALAGYKSAALRAPLLALAAHLSLEIN